MLKDVLQVSSRDKEVSVEELSPLVSVCIMQQRSFLTPIASVRKLIFRTELKVKRLLFKGMEM